MQAQAQRYIDNKANNLFEMNVNDFIFKSNCQNVYNENISNYEFINPYFPNYKTIISPNALIYSDNYKALSEMINNGLKVNLIYIDPPYCTGETFLSRSQELAYSDEMSVTDYVAYMRERLILFREVLDDNGSIYVHIGHQMLAYIKVIMDEIFGMKNFKNIITRKKCSSKNYTRNQYANLNDFILFYTKSKNYTWNRPGVTPSEEWIEKEYPKIDKKGRYKLVPIHAPGVRNGETGKQWRNLMPPPGKHWQYIPSKLDEMDKNGEIHWSSNGNPRRKVYYETTKLLNMTDYWDNYRDAHHQSIKITGYPTEKNINMLKTIIAASSNEGDVVLDGFCGSGSTLQASSELSRSWIGIDNSSLAIQTVIKRFKMGVCPMGDYVNKKHGRVLNEDFCHAEYNLLIERSLFKDNKLFD